MYFNLKFLFSRIFIYITSERGKGNGYLVFWPSLGNRHTSSPVVIHCAKQISASKFCELLHLSNISMVPACLLGCPSNSLSNLHQRLHIQISFVLSKGNGETVHSPSIKRKKYIRNELKIQIQQLPPQSLSQKLHEQASVSRTESAFIFIFQ